MLISTHAQEEPDVTALSTKTRRVRIDDYQLIILNWMSFSGI